MRRPTTGRIRRRLLAFAISVLASITLAVVLGAAYREEVRRYIELSRLCAEDQARRQAAVIYVAERVGDPELARRAAAALDRASQACFDRAVAELSALDRWGPWAGRAWVRYLTTRAAQATPKERSQIAVELGRMLWLREPMHDDPRIVPAVEGLLRDEDPNVRVNALSAAACIADSRRFDRIDSLKGDAHPQVAERTARLLELITQKSPLAAQPVVPDDPALLELAELEASPAASKPLEVKEEMPEMLRLQAVRVSSTSKPDDLWRVFDSEQPPLRDLACVGAIERFTPSECRTLASRLLGSLNDRHRISGAILAGLIPGATSDPELMRWLRYRAEPSDSWLVRQHALLGLAMIGEPTGGFDPASLLQHTKVPRSTVILALLHTGRLEGLDWLINPFGESPVSREGFRLLLVNGRYWRVVQRFVPGMPEPSFWADEAAQRSRLEWLRDWYLVHRPTLVFDPDAHTFKSKDGPR